MPGDDLRAMVVTGYDAGYGLEAWRLVLLRANFPWPEPVEGPSNPTPPGWSFAFRPNIRENQLSCQLSRFIAVVLLLVSGFGGSFSKAWAATPKSPDTADRRFDLASLSSAIIFRGNETTAYRDPTAVYHDGWVYLIFEIIKIEPDQKPYVFTAWSKSRDLAHWSEPKIFTPRDRNLNYGSPGNVIRVGNEWILCLQTYPRPHDEKYGNADSRIWIMRSKDLENWGAPELLSVMGPKVSREDMGRMIDPFLLEDKDEAGKWWCFFKRNGSVTLSWSRDLKAWTYTGRNVAGGENPCVIRDGDAYVLFFAPANGIGVKRSSDLTEWNDEGVIKLGQKEWPWAQGRLTAGFVLDLRQEPGVGKALMFFHGSAYPETDPRGGFDNFASVGLAWSTDLKHWDWPGKSQQTSW